jgi:hypothetical protein
MFMPPPNQSSSSQSSHPFHSMPPRPSCRPAPSRSATLCFWTVMLLFFAIIGFVGMLAYTRNSGQAQPDSSSGGHLVIGILLVGFAVAAIIGVISTRHNREH